MTGTNRPFDFDEVRSDFATGVVRAQRDERHAELRRGHDRHGGGDARGADDRRYRDDAGYGDSGPGGAGGPDDDHGSGVDDRASYRDDYDRDDFDDEYEDQNRIDVEPRRTPRRQHQADAEELLQRVIDVVASARSLPLSASVSINRDEVLELLEEAQQRLPDELREARWLRKEREQYLEKMRGDGDEILQHARARVEQMVQRTEVVKAAEHRARRIIENAEAEARRLRLETEDFCDGRLARFEIILERTLKTVSSGRAKLQSTGARPPQEQERGEPGR